MIRKINFKQPKYIFPLVVFIPLCALVYFVMQTFGAAKMPSRRLPPTASIRNCRKPMRRKPEIKCMRCRAALGTKMPLPLSVPSVKNRRKPKNWSTATAKTNSTSWMQRKRNGFVNNGKWRNWKGRWPNPEDTSTPLPTGNNATGSTGNSQTGQRTISSGTTAGYTSQDEFAKDLEEIQRRSYERQKAIESGLGIGRFDRDEQAEKQRKDSIAKVRQAEKERNRPKLVIKSGDTNAEKFHTVTSPDDIAEAKLIRAMIDQTTKAKEGTRLRFKLLDDITVSNTKLKKGTYLYGTVTGFGQKRVKATITSILVGDKFINVKLSVFDNDGMEGFYVPESSFREFVKDASSSAVQQNINFQSEDGYGSGISGEALALQALQNVYNSASSAISSNIRKNKAKIKYNTIVYLINSEEAR